MMAYLFRVISLVDGDWVVSLCGHSSAIRSDSCVQSLTATKSGEPVKPECENPKQKNREEYVFMDVALRSEPPESVQVINKCGV